MRIALFDLDHTLIPFDSGMAWTRFLVARGVLDAAAQARYLDTCRKYVAGTLDIHAMHRAAVAPLIAVPRATLAELSAAFESSMAPGIPSAMRALVDAHRSAGEVCLIVTATTRLVAAPFARLFGVDHLLATEAATLNGEPDGALSGEIAGVPCYREHKLTHLQRWLHAGGRRLDELERSWFYTDSASDLPLLRAVTDPVAVAPDAGLRAQALAAGWPIIEAAADVPAG